MVLKTKYSIDAFVVSAFLLGEIGDHEVAVSTNLRMTSFCDSSVYTWPKDEIDGGTEFQGVLVFDDDTDQTGLNSHFKIQDGDIFESDIGGSLCLGSPKHFKETLFSLKGIYNPLKISFWFDLTVNTYDLAIDENQQTGVVIFGGDDPDRFFQGTETRFVILTSSSEPSVGPRGWLTAEPVILRTADSSISHAALALFDIESTITFVPQNVYAAIVGNLKPLIRDQLQHIAKLPPDLVGLVNDFAGPSPEENIFDCKNIKYLNSFKLGELLIHRDMLYDRTPEGQCHLRIAPLPDEYPNIFLVGFHLMKQFYVLVEMDTPDGSYLEFSRRKGVNPNRPIKNDCSIC